MPMPDPPPGTAAPNGGTDPAADLQDLARDWITLWQSELAAAAVDREAQESWHTLLALWAGAAGMILQSLPRGMPDGPGGHVARPAAAPRPPPAAAAPDARDAEVERLARRVAELEQRLADLERGR